MSFCHSAEGKESNETKLQFWVTGRQISPLQKKYKDICTTVAMFSIFSREPTDKSLTPGAPRPPGATRSQPVTDEDSSNQGGFFHLQTRTDPPRTASTEGE